MKPEEYPTTHTIARRLLELPDITAIVQMPIFDAPGEALAMPVGLKEMEIDGRQCIAFINAEL